MASASCSAAIAPFELHVQVRKLKLEATKPKFREIYSLLTGCKYYIPLPRSSKSRLYKGTKDVASGKSMHSHTFTCSYVSCLSRCKSKAIPIIGRGGP
jgi:hypothetical protein